MWIVNGASEYIYIFILLYISHAHEKYPENDIRKLMKIDDLNFDFFEKYAGNNSIAKAHPLTSIAGGYYELEMSCSLEV